MPRPDAIAQCEVGPQTIMAIARKAAELAGLPPEMYPGLPQEKRYSFEVGVANVLGALTALGWGLVPPENMPTSPAVGVKPTLI